MKTQITMCLVLFVSFSLNGQNVIKVRPQHQKELLYTLKDKEYFLGENESSIDISLNGVAYMFRTTVYKPNNVFEHSRGKPRRQVMLYQGYPIFFKNFEIQRVERNFFVYNRKTRKRSGPFRRITPAYDRSKFYYSDQKTGKIKSKLFGYVYYKKNESLPRDTTKNRNLIKVDYVKRIGKPAVGPFISAKIYCASESNFIYSYQTEDGVFLSKNDTVYGPFEKILYNSLPNQLSKGSFCYQTDSIWYIHNEHYKSYSFRKKPRILFSNLGSGFEGEVIEKGNVNYQFYDNGHMTESSANSFDIYNRKKDTLNFRSVENYSTKSQFNKYMVSCNEKELGIFRTKYVVSFSDNENSDVFPYILIKTDTSVGNLYSKQSYFYSASKGLLGPFDISGYIVYHIKFFDNNYAIINREDSTLLVNGEVVDKNVVGIDYTNYPKTWWMIKSEGDYHITYKNGAKASVKEMPDNYLKRVYNRTPDKPFITVVRDSLTYLKPQKSKRLIGPVKAGSEFALASDEKNYAQCLRRGNIILINGKAISEGFNLVYNKDLNAFHWFSIKNAKNIYLNTYEID